LTNLLKKPEKEAKMRMTGSQIDQEIAGVVTQLRPTADVETPPTQELPVELANLAPDRLSRSRRRYSALAAAVRSHERSHSHPAVPKRPADHALYAALSRLETNEPAAGDQLR
jgi:hypothetical protein